MRKSLSIWRCLVAIGLNRGGTIAVLQNARLRRLVLFAGGATGDNCMSFASLLEPNLETALGARGAHSR